MIEYTLMAPESLVHITSRSFSLWCAQKTNCSLKFGLFRRGKERLERSVEGQIVQKTKWSVRRKQRIRHSIVIGGRLNAKRSMR
jgi:hypothetical protein